MPDPHAQDKELVARCLGGKAFGSTPGVASPWDELVRRAEPVVRQAVRHALRRAGKAAGASAEDDLVQETFLKITQRDGELLRRFQWRCSLNHYLGSVALYQCVTWLRQRPDWVSLDQTAGSDAVLRDLMVDGASQSPAGAAASPAAERVNRAMSRLQDRDRLILTLFYWGGTSTALIARLLGASPGTARVSLTRARQRLGDLLRKMPPLILF